MPGQVYWLQQYYLLLLKRSRVRFQRGVGPCLARCAGTACSRILLPHKQNDIKHFEQCVVSEYTRRMLSGWLVETGHSPWNLAHALLSHSYQGSSPGLWNSPYYHLLKYLLFLLKHPVCVCVCVCIHTHKHTHIYTYIHTYIHTNSDFNITLLKFLCYQFAYILEIQNFKHISRAQ